MFGRPPFANASFETEAGFMASELAEKGGNFCWLATKP